MEKNVYQTLQDWHELLKAGVITDAEFAVKKKELLGGEKSTQKNSQEDGRILTYEEQAQIDAEYNLTYEELFAKPKWYKQCKYGLITSIILVIAVSTGIYFVHGASKTEKNNAAYISNSDSNSYNPETEPTSVKDSYYIVNADEFNLVHFYKNADVTTQKASYFSSSDTVFVEKIENDFGYVEFTNGKSQTSKGWLRMQDLQSCSDCEKYGKTSFGIYQLVKDNDCAIKNAGLRIDKPINGKFNFAIAVDGLEQDGMTMSGRLKGKATFISSKVAIFKDQDCKSLIFTFLELNIVKVEESECNTYHGAGICFDASFIKPDN
jgi:hypothetical protein